MNDQKQNKALQLTRLKQVLIALLNTKLNKAIENLIKRYRKQLLPLLANQLKGKHTALEALIPPEVWNYFTSYPEIINGLRRSFPELMQDKKLKKIFKRAIEEELRSPYIQQLQVKHRQAELKGLLKPLPNLSQKQTYGSYLSIFHNIVSTITPQFSKNNVIKFAIVPLAGYNAKTFDTIKHEAYSGLQQLNKQTLEMINPVSTNLLYIIYPNPACPHCVKLQKKAKELLKYFKITYNELQAFEFLIKYVVDSPEFKSGLEQLFNQHINYLKNLSEFKMDILKQVIFENKGMNIKAVKEYINNSAYNRNNIDAFIMDSLKDLNINFKVYENKVNQTFINAEEILKAFKFRTSVFKPYKGYKTLLQVFREFKSTNVGQ